MHVLDFVKNHTPEFIAMFLGLAAMGLGGIAAPIVGPAAAATAGSVGAALAQGGGVGIAAAGAGDLANEGLAGSGRGIQMALNFAGSSVGKAQAAKKAAEAGAAEAARLISAGGFGLRNPANIIADERDRAEGRRQTTIEEAFRASATATSPTAVPASSGVWINQSNVTAGPVSPATPLAPAAAPGTPAASIAPTELDPMGRC
jgi:hypothetical protein